MHKLRSSSGRGGTAPPGSAQWCYTPSHKLRSSNGRVEAAPPWMHPSASGDTRLHSRTCLMPRTPHICIPSLPLPLAPQGRWQIEKLSGLPMCAVLARTLFQDRCTRVFLFSPVMPHIMANTRCAHWHSYPHRGEGDHGRLCCPCSPTPSPPYDPIHMIHRRQRR